MASRVITRDPAPPAPPTDEGGGGGGWAWLLTANGLVEAQLVRGVLEDGGVPVVLDGRDRTPFAWMYLAGNVNAPVQIYVPAALVDSARLQLLEAGLNAPTDDVPAPEPEVRLPAPRVPRLLRVLLLLVAAVSTAYVVLASLFPMNCALRPVC